MDFCYELEFNQSITLTGRINAFADDENWVDRNFEMGHCDVLS